MVLIDKLVRQGKLKGALTIDEIMTVLPAVGQDAYDLDEVYDRLESEGISILEPEEEVQPEESPESPVINRDLSEAELDDTLPFYMLEVGRTPLLTADDEVRLARKIEAGNLAKRRLSRVADLAPENISKLRGQIAEGEAAKAELVRANLRLVMHIAKRYRGQGLSYGDLIQEGNLGLIRAAEKFDYRKGNRFSTYATWWIRQAIARGVASQGQTIRLPLHLGERVRRVQQVADRLRKETGQEPEAGEIAQQMDLSLQQVQRAITAPKPTISLERPVGAEGEGNLGEFVSDETASPVEMVEQRQLAGEIRDMLEQLPDRERRIIVLRYGLVDGEPRSLKDIAKEFNLSRERVRQIEREALMHLRQSQHRSQLQAYLS
ncbi:MAG: sigma-70 family RNA polymerase sigma factor [Chloroflexi bacterium]|nr:sigma-70 family RNA polymerase sigma factor [Chloroflexota bacterium]